MHRLPRSLLLLAFALQLLPVVARPHLIGGDEPHYALMAHSLAVDGDLSLVDDYEEVEAGSDAAGKKRAGSSLDRHLRTHGNDLVGVHPAGLPLLVAPLLRLQAAVLPSLPPDYMLIGLTAAISFVAFVLGWDVLVGWLGRRDGTLVAFAIWFSTPLWFYGRIFMTEPYLAALLTASIWAMRRERFLLMGSLLGLAFWIKETSLLFVLPLVVVAVRERQRNLPVVAIPLALLLLGWIVKNVVIYGDALVTFQPFQYGNLLDGLAGISVDPRHGLVPYAPIVLLCLAGWMMFPRSDKGLLLASAGAFFSYLLLVAAWVDWRGGSGYGPRLMIAVLPVLAVPLGSLISSIGRFSIRRWIAAFAIAGFSVNAVAVSDPWESFWSPHLLDQMRDQPHTFLIAAVVGGLLFRRLSAEAPVER